MIMKMWMLLQSICHSMGLAFSCQRMNHRAGFIYIRVQEDAGADSCMKITGGKSYGK